MVDIYQNAYSKLASSSLCYSGTVYMWLVLEKLLHTTKVVYVAADVVEAYACKAFEELIMLPQYPV